MKPVHSGSDAPADELASAWCTHPASLRSCRVLVISTSRHRQPHRRSKSGPVTPRHAVDDDDVPVVERAPHQGPHPVPVLLPSVGVGDGEVLHVSPGQGHTLPLGQPLREANHLKAARWKGCGRDCRGDARQKEGSSPHVVVDQRRSLGGLPPHGR